MDTETKIKNAIAECFGKLRDIFEMEGLELDYDKQDYVEEMILEELHLQKSN